MRRVVAVVLVAALVLAAIGVTASVLLADGSGSRSEGSSEPGGEPSEARSPEAGSTEPPGRARGLERFYGQRLSWSACGEHECARLRVPLDYDRPRGRSLEIALLKVPASGRAQGSLVVNPGGPGAPGTGYAAAAGEVLGAPLLRAYDVVGFDPRGTGTSSPVDCVTDAELDAYLAADPAPDDPGEADRFVRLVSSIGRGCAADDRALSAHVSTIEASRDMDVLRSALGERRLDYLGKSYGTRLGATYAELFPRQVGRFVLDGALDPRLSSRGLSLGQAAGFERALTSYVDNCVESTDTCFLGDSVEAGLRRIADFVAEVDAEPLATQSDRELAVGNAFYGIVTPLYDRAYWTILTTALQAGFDGDGTALLQLSDAYASRGPDGSYADNSAEAFVAINCLDDPYALSPSKVPAQLAEFRKVSPTFGEVFAWGLTGCLGQVTQTSEEPLRVDAAGADPIVVVGTTRDPATPYVWSRALARQLESGVLVTRDGDGHTGYQSGNLCVDEAVESYLLQGDVPRDGLRC